MAGFLSNTDGSVSAVTAVAAASQPSFSDLPAKSFRLLRPSEVIYVGTTRYAVAHRMAPLPWTDPVWERAGADVTRASVVLLRPPPHGRDEGEALAALARALLGGGSEGARIGAALRQDHARIERLREQGALGLAAGAELKPLLVASCPGLRRTSLFESAWSDGCGPTLALGYVVCFRSGPVAPRS